MRVQINNEKNRGAQVKEFLNEHSFEEIHEMLDKLYSGWAMSAAMTSEREERLRTLIFFDELKQFFEQIEENC
jgi:hypothetical protein